MNENVVRTKQDLEARRFSESFNKKFNISLGVQKF